jgi:hypothetical protein
MMLENMFFFEDGLLCIRFQTHEGYEMKLKTAGAISFFLSAFNYFSGLPSLGARQKEEKLECKNK